MKVLIPVLISICITSSLNGQIKPDVEWVDIPAGTFMMGSPKEEIGRNNGEVQHQVTLNAFKMSRFEITFEQYDNFCESTKRKKPADSGWGRNKRPVINITREDAIAFASWMGCRLPTEAEWEYACRAGSTTPFNTGTDLNTSEANYNGNYPYNEKQIGLYRQKTMPVGSFAPNAWGLYDMHGNVSEWVSDLWEEYDTDPQTNPSGAVKGNILIWRGGSWDRQAFGCRCAQRFELASIPNYGRNFIGFRLVSSDNIKIAAVNNTIQISDSKTVIKSNATTGKSGITSTSLTSTSSSATITYGKPKSTSGREISKSSEKSISQTVPASSSKSTIASDNGGLVTDIDGNVYHSIRIGNQVWLIENLKTTHYRNGDPILKVTKNPEWSSMSTGAYCDYGNEDENAGIYSHLYNFYAVTDNRNIAPEGWHIPSDSEWALLSVFLGGDRAAGGKLKESGLSHWTGQNVMATNECGFTATPGGYRFSDGAFYYMGYQGYWWSTTSYSESEAWFRNLYYDRISVIRDTFKKNMGFSVRCLKD